MLTLLVERANKAPSGRTFGLKKKALRSDSENSDSSPISSESDDLDEMNCPVKAMGAAASQKILRNEDEDIFV